MPVTRSSNQRSTVTKNVTMTTFEWKPFFMPPSMFSSMRFCVKGNAFSRMRQLMNSRTMTSGNMNIIH